MTQTQAEWNRTWRLLACVLLVMAAGSLALLLVAREHRGNGAFETTAMILGAAELIGGLLALHEVGRRPATTSQQRLFSRPGDRESSPAGRRIAWGLAGVVFFAGPWALWVAAGRAEIHVTKELGSSAAARTAGLLGPGSVNLRVPGSPPARGKLLLLITLDVTQQPGCQAATTYTLTPVIDGKVSRDSTEARSADEGYGGVVAVGGAKQSVTVVVTGSPAAYRCPFRVTVDKAVLHN
ncbi:hypothetical protein [Longispora albida]|uniref:hypothetical protein n=1 Tax=Longispora albida TaxID=203523 RepID=UPI0003787884|nr:hypothetical protein [Longispora albida]